MSNGNTVSFYSASRVRQNLPYFVSGRAISAVGAFGSIVLVVRTLSAPDFGVFSIVIGSAILFGLLCGLGIERLIPRYLSEFRSAGAMGNAAYLAWLFLLMRILLLVPAFVALFFAWHAIGTLLDVRLDIKIFWASITYVGAFLVGKQTADTLQAVMSHREASIGFAADALIRLVVLGALALERHLTLEAAIWGYAAGAAVGAILCTGAMLRVFNARMESPFLSANRGSLDLASIVRYGRHAYIHNIAGLLLTPQALRIFCASLLGAAGIAALGFAQSISEFAKRYLPVVFLASMIEPILIGRYRDTRDFSSLNNMASVMFKINLFLLMPLVGWLGTSGQGALELVTGGKYVDQSWLLVGLLFLLAFDAHRALLHTVIMAIDATPLLVLSQLWPSVMLPGLLALVYYWGLSGLLGGLAVIMALVNVLLVRQLHSHGYDYRIDWSGIARIVANAAAGSGIGMLVVRSIGGWPGSLLAAGGVCIVFLGLGRWHQSFEPEERMLINKLLGRPLWIW